jgi:hypothetical protein
MGQVLQFKKPEAKMAPPSDPYKELDKRVRELEAKEPKAPNAQIAHLMTQRNQPYGSERRCCEVCGRMIIGTMNQYTDDEDVYNHLDKNYIRCRDVPSDKR